MRPLLGHWAKIIIGVPIVAVALYAFLVWVG
jgi:hypothetical protein